LKVLRDDRVVQHHYALPLWHGDTIEADRLGIVAGSPRSPPSFVGITPSAVFLLQILISIERRPGSPPKPKLKPTRYSGLAGCEAFAKVPR
jgi:hypothetical protein